MKREETPPDSEFQKSLHLSTGLAGMVLLLVIQQHIKTYGYVLSRSKSHSTDFLMWIYMCIIAAIWTSLIFLSGWIFDDEQPCVRKRCFRTQCPVLLPFWTTFWECCTRIAFAPWILNVACLWWAMSYMIYHFLRRLGIHQFAMIDPRDSGIDINPLHREFYSVGLRRSHSYVILIIGSITFFTVTGAFISDRFTLSTLSMAAFLIFYHGRPDEFFDAEVPHKSRLDDIRIPLLAHVDQCIVYILPTRQSKFDVRFTSRIDAEYEVLDSNRSMLEPLDLDLKEWSLESCRNAMRKTIRSHIRKIIPGHSADALNHLAKKLYNKEGPALQDNNMIHGENKSSDAIEAEYNARLALNSSLIGRDIVMALLHWESLIFEWRNKLEQPLRESTWLLRRPTYSTDIQPELIHSQVTLGSEGGLEGLKSACQQVYDILSPGGEWTLPQTSTPKKSVVFDQQCLASFKSLENYAETLWRKCWDTDPSTFGALYLWTTVWYLDMGNDQGIQSTPLLPKRNVPNDLTYTTNWRMRWRHTWHTAVVCQLVVIFPTILSSLFRFGG